MVRVIKLMIRKSKSGKKYYRIAMPIANEIFDKAGFKQNGEFKVLSKKNIIIVKRC